MPREAPKKHAVLEQYFLKTALGAVTVDVRQVSKTLPPPMSTGYGLEKVLSAVIGRTCLGVRLRGLER